MARDPGALEAALNEALGDDHALIGELRAAFVASASGHVAAMRSATSDHAFADAARRLQGLAASFGADAIRSAALAAQKSAIANRPQAVDRIKRLIDRLA
jgi:HPt (histidine-containing phosphotransfer) domain-containing protein